MGYSLLVWGFVFLKLYNWLILPIFVGMPIITYWNAVGVWVFSTLIKAHFTVDVKDEFLNSVNSKYYALVLLPWITLLLGYIIK